MHQHSASLARVFCAHLKEHLKTTLNVLNHVAGSNLLAVEDGLNQKVFWCTIFFVFLADATKEKQWLAALMEEFGYDSKDVILDIGMIDWEILFQVELCWGFKSVVKKIWWQCF